MAAQATLCVRLCSAVSALLLVVASEGCSAAGERRADKDRDGEKDESLSLPDIRTVENDTPGAPHGIWATVDSYSSVEIGLAAGADPYLFSSVLAAFEAPDGEILVADSATRQIRVFDATGEYIDSFGGAGYGPGEFAGEPVLRFFRPDGIVAWDRRVRRLTYFSARGALIEDMAMPWVMWGTVVKLHPDGTIVWVDATNEGTKQFGNLVRETVTLAIANTESEVIRRIGDLPGLPRTVVDGTSATGLLYSTAGGHNWAVRVDPPAIVVADNPEGRWTLSLYDLEGNLVESVRCDIPQIKVTRALEQTYRTYHSGFATSYPAGQRSDFLEAVQRTPTPEKAPAISAVLTDAANRIWVKRWSAPWETEGVDLFDVIDPRGHWLGWVEVDRRFGRIQSIGQDHVLFEWKDSMDLPRIRRHALRVHEGHD